MTPINAEVVTRLLAEMEQAVVKLRSLSAISQDKFLADSNFYDAAKYNLIVAVEALIDVPEAAGLVEPILWEMRSWQT